MRMKNRFCRIGKSLVGAACLLSTCGITYSCSDDYDLDETKPSFLGQSIYDELKNRQDRKFTTVIRLIDDLDYKDVLSKTGSKTLFVADDDAYSQFFANNSWGVSRYEDLSKSQKKLLLYGSMLDNAYVLEMLSTIQGPVKNLCLRQLSTLSVTDSVPYYNWQKLPNNLNNNDGQAITPDKRYWDNYRKEAKGGIYMVTDKTTPMMTHFLQAQMNEKIIKPSDISFILGLDGTDKAWHDSSNRSFIFNSEIVEPDVTCLNGYYHVLDKVMVPPTSMADMISKNPDTHYIAAMLDRFSAPYYDATITQAYNQLPDTKVKVDSVFQKLYIAQRGQMGNVSRDPSGETLGSDVSRLSFDPGWNAYTVPNSTKEQDMGAMFIPSDEAVEQYFLHGVGRSLIQNYAHKDNTAENLLENLYQIPQNILVKLINNMMKESFNASVPSKYLSVMNSAQDQMFSQYNTEQDFKNAIKQVMVANNGVVYVMNDLIPPPDYASVSGPVLTDQSTRVFNTVLHADDNFITSNYSSAPLRKFYSTYLLAMQSHFTLFVPVDKGLAEHGYVDPVSFTSGVRTNYRFWSMSPQDVGKTTNAVVGVNAAAYKYKFDSDFTVADAEKATSAQGGMVQIESKANETVNSGWGKTKRQMLTDMVDQHILVHNDGDEMIDGNRNYYVARSGAPIHISKLGTNTAEGVGMEVEGGLQAYLNGDSNADNDFTCKVEKGYDLSEGYGNGHTFFLDRPMQPTIYNVQQVLNTMANPSLGYMKFASMCKELVYGANEELLAKIFPEEYAQTDTWNTEKQKYAIYASSTKGGRYTASGTNLIRFFNNYRYTVFVPSDEAIDQAISEGLPTLSSIEEFCNNPENLVGGKLTDEAKAKAQAMYTCLVNFLKYHFIDQSYFVDKYTDSNVTLSQSACSDEVKKTFIPVAIKHVAGGLEVFDARAMSRANSAGTFENTGSVINNTHVNVKTDNRALFNQFARDYETDETANSAREIKSSSYVVLHTLKNKEFLLFDANLEGNFAKRWATTAEAKAFVKKFRLKK